MLKHSRAGLLVLSLLTLSTPTYVSAAQTTPTTAAPAAERVTTVDEDSETDRGWVGLLPLLGAATFMVVAIAVTVNFMRRKR